MDGDDRNGTPKQFVTKGPHEGLLQPTTVHTHPPLANEDSLLCANRATHGSPRALGAVCPLLPLSLTDGQTKETTKDGLHTALSRVNAKS